MMELEFDKEIDAILRKAREPVTAFEMAASDSHLDADAIAAFAENAIPEKAKLLYIAHFADCDRCRTVLSDSIHMRTEAQPTFASTAAPIVAETAIPWYQKLFRSSNLALAMGALVLAFSGVLGYLVLQNRNAATDSTISKVTEPRAGAPFSNSDGRSFNTSANTAAPANASSNSSVTGMSPIAASNSSAKPEAQGGGPNTGLDKDVVSDGAPPEAAKPVAAPPPAPVDQSATVGDDKKAVENKLKTESVDERRKEDNLSKTSTEQVARDTQLAAKRSGPNARSVQANQQQIENAPNVAGMVASEKRASGKTFQNRNGTWYDRAYSGQATVNVSRGSDEYKKLDGGLRSIAESIGGTVVVVWKGKAYRIQ